MLANESAAKFADCFTAHLDAEFTAHFGAESTVHFDAEFTAHFDAESAAHFDAEFTAQLATERGVHITRIFQSITARTQNPYAVRSLSHRIHAPTKLHCCQMMGQSMQMRRKLI